MEMEADIIEVLKSVGYHGKFVQQENLEDAVAGGPKTESFRELIIWVTYELHVLRNTDEKVGKETDFNEFMLELSAFLKELGCPFDDIVSGPLTGRFQTKESRILLLDYLLTELMTSKMCLHLTPQEDSYIIPVFETPTASALQCITKELSLGKPPENISSRILFEKISNKIDEVVKKENPKRLSKPLFECTKNLSDAQWEHLGKLQKELDEEYNLRRQMLLTRLEVTIQSFQWSEKMKCRGDEIMNKYQSKSKDLEQYGKGDIDTDIAALLAARADLGIIEKTSSANVGSKIQKHVIGKVPDRGGRAYEHAPPPPEMPSWQQNRSTGPSQSKRGGGGSGRGGSGGINRGGGRTGDVIPGNWTQQNQGQNQNYGQQRQSFEQRQQYDQRQPQQSMGPTQYHQQYGPRQDNQWHGSGSGGDVGRVQGGWSQRGSDKSFNQRSGCNEGYYNSNQGNNYGQNERYQGYGDGVGYSNDRGGRGRSNYNRRGSGRR